LVVQIVFVGGVNLSVVGDVCVNVWELCIYRFVFILAQHERIEYNVIELLTQRRIVSSRSGVFHTELKLFVQKNCSDLIYFRSVRTVDVKHHTSVQSVDLSWL